MKKLAFLVVGLLSAACLAWASDPAQGVTAHYDVRSTAPQASAQSIANEMEAYFSLYDGLFHFDPSALKGKLSVRIFGTQAELDSYLAGIVPGVHASFVFLQYPDPTRNLLVGAYTGNPASFSRALVHHGFVQFLRSFIAHPPLWLQEGGAVYFEASTYDSAKGVAHFHPNLDWVATLKQDVGSYLSGSDPGAIIPLSTLLTMDSDAALKQLPAFYAEAWGLVSFLASSTDPAFSRILWDGITAMRPDATAEENARAMESRAFSWVPENTLLDGFASYLDTVKTFPELVNAGMRAYSAGDLAAAEGSFKQALTLDDASSIPYYYLGLIKFGEKSFYLADQYFQTALQKGADRGLVEYALGVTAYADDRLDDAKSYLSQAMASPDYNAVASTLLQRIQGSSAQ